MLLFHINRLIESNNLFIGAGDPMALVEEGLDRIQERIKLGI
jgi:hypothetical protein